MENSLLFLRVAFQRNAFFKSIRLAFVVGSILNLTNQGEVILAMEWAEINLLKFLLTFLVPFLVSTYVGAQTRLEFKIGEKAPTDARLECYHCKGSYIEVHEGEATPICPKCNEETTWVKVS